MADVCCPYCGNSQNDPVRCAACGGLFEQMSRQATQLAMGPWSVRDEGKPFMPGFSVEVLKHQVMSGRIKADTPVRGPTTHQFWVPAIQTPGVSRLLGKCHACAASVAPHAKTCPKCEADLVLPEEVDRLGLQFTTQGERIAAQEAIAFAQQNQPARSSSASPAPSSASGPQQPAHAPRSNTTPSQGPDSGHDIQASLTPIDSPQNNDGPNDHPDIEALWEAAPVHRKRIQRSGTNPLLIGVVLVTLIGVFIAGYFAMTAASKRHEQGLSQLPAGEQKPAAASEQVAPIIQPPPQVPRTSEQVAQVRTSVLSAKDQLGMLTVPVVFAEDFDAFILLIAQAEAAHQEEDYSAAYRLFREADESGWALENTVAEHMVQMDDRERARVLQAKAEAARAVGLADDAARWAPPDWALAEEGMARGRAALESDEPDALRLAQRAFRQAVSDYGYALAQSSMGFLAVQAGEKLSQAIEDSFSNQELESFGGSAYTQMQELQQSGRSYLAAYAYHDAIYSFEVGLIRLDLAERGVKRVHSVKFFAFAAGYNATDALITIAAGDGMSPEKRQLLREAFTDLTLEADVVAALPQGASPDYAACAQVLVLEARDAIALELGQEAQLSYGIGFQFRIIQQTLDSPRLSSGQTRRIDRALQRIESSAEQAGYSRALASRLDAFTQQLQGVTDGDQLENARSAWRDLIILMRDYDRAIPIVNPSPNTTPNTVPDPELFPGAGE